MRLTILGGGGFRVPLVYRALVADHRRTGITEVMLHDVDAGRLHGIGRVLADMARGAPDAPAVCTSTDLDTAVSGASFVFCAIRVGGLRGRVIDERVALDAGVLGQETVGAGGISYGLRTVPVALRIAERIARLAPDAWTINFTNPAGLVTEAMATHLGHRVIGICDSPAGLVGRVLRTIGADPATVHVDYAGLNHLGWLYGIHPRVPADSPAGRTPEAGGAPSESVHRPTDVPPEGVCQRLGEVGPEGVFQRLGGVGPEGVCQRLGEVGPEGVSQHLGAVGQEGVSQQLGGVAPGSVHHSGAGPDGNGRPAAGRGLLATLLEDTALLETIEEGRLFGADRLRDLGAVPNEYLHYYYDPAGTLAAVQAAPQTRGAFLLEQQHRCYARISSPDRDPFDAWREAWREREATYMAENRELAGAGDREHDESRPAGYEGVALAVMRALAHDEPATLILNVRNRGTLGALDDEAVVEVPCTVDAQGAAPHAVAPLPGHGVELVRAVKTVERGVLEAVAGSSRAAAVRAMAAHPLVGSDRVARRLIDAYRTKFAELGYLR